MSNNTILEKRWTFTDRKLKEYLSIYKKINVKTQDNMQDIFNSIDYEYTDLNKPISKSKRNKLNRVIDEWEEDGLLTGYFKYSVELLMSKRYITNEELLNILLWGMYIKERNELNKYEKNLFMEIGQNLYAQGVEELNPKKKNKWSLTWEYIWSLLCLPNIKGSSWNVYVEALPLTCSQEICRQAVIQLQQGKKLNIEDDIFKNIINKQGNRYISINGDKISGALDSQVVEIANELLLKAGNDYGNKKTQVRFIAEMDERTTKMCKGMNNMLFYVNDWNKFYRYSAVDERDVLYTVKGLKRGINLPPINNHFHYCRSTITYMVDMPREELNEKIISWDERNALYKYLGGKSITINDKMRNNERLTADEKKYKKDLYRALNKMPFYNGDIVRVVDIKDSEMLKTFLEEYRTGNIIRFKQFTSFSNKSGYNDNANINIWVQNSKKAKNVLKYSQENEILYQYGVKLKVLNAVEKDNKYYILLEELND